MEKPFDDKIRSLIVLAISERGATVTQIVTNIVSIIVNSIESSIVAGVMLPFIEEICCDKKPVRSTTFYEQSSPE